MAAEAVEVEALQRVGTHFCVVVGKTGGYL